MLAEIKIRAERKAGQLLKQIEKSKGAATRKRGNTMLPRKTLNDIGITKIQSSRWQQEADIPEDIFKQHIQET